MLIVWETNEEAKLTVPVCDKVKTLTCLKHDVMQMDLRPERKSIARLDWGLTHDSWIIQE